MLPATPLLAIILFSCLICNDATLTENVTLVDHTEAELKRTKDDKDRMEKEKDEKIKELEIKINSMGLAYENVLNVCTFLHKMVRPLLVKVNKVLESADPFTGYKSGKTNSEVLRYVYPDLTFLVLIFVELVPGKQFISFPFISHKTQQVYTPLCVTKDDRIRILYS